MTLAVKSWDAGPRRRAAPISLKAQDQVLNLSTILAATVAGDRRQVRASGRGAATGDLPVSFTMVLNSWGVAKLGLHIMAFASGSTRRGFRASLPFTRWDGSGRRCRWDI